MRWEALFADLEQQFAQAVRTEADEEIVDLTEAELAQVSLMDRVRARHGQELTIRLSDGSDVRGTVVDAAVQWLLIADAGRRVLVPATAVVTARSLERAAPQALVVERRLRLTHVLRALAREETAVVVRTSVGEVRGRITRVGGDHLDVDTGPPGATSLALAHVLAVLTP